PTSGGAATPTFRALGASDFNSGTGASSATFLRGDFVWATPVGSGGAVAISFSALKALSPANGDMAIVNDASRAGIFIFDSSPHTTDVTNDPGQGIWVAPNGATSGSSGAWKRQYSGSVDWRWWGAIPDGVTTDPWGLVTGSSTIVSGTDN